MKIVYWNNIPTPYIVDRFNILSESSSFEFEAWFTDQTKSGRSWDINESEWKFNYKYFGNNIITRAVRVVNLIRKNPPNVIITIYGEALNLVGAYIAQKKGSRIIFMIDGISKGWVRKRLYRELIKRIVLRKADGIFCAGEDSMEEIKKYGVRQAAISKIHTPVDVEYIKANTSLSDQEIEKIRKDLNIKGLTFLYVGRLWRGKGISYLLDAYKKLLAEGHDISLILVGDGEDEKQIREHCSENELTSVIFSGFKQYKELLKYYAISDVFVFPSLGDPYGLVINEAMAASLPVICTDIIGEARERVEHGVNGYIVRPECSQDLFLSMLDMVDREKGLRMGKESYEKIREHTIERWVAEIEYGVKAIVNV